MRLFTVKEINWHCATPPFWSLLMIRFYKCMKWVELEMNKYWETLDPCYKGMLFGKRSSARKSFYFPFHTSFTVISDCEKCGHVNENQTFSHNKLFYREISSGPSGHPLTYSLNDYHVLDNMRVTRPAEWTIEIWFFALEDDTFDHWESQIHTHIDDVPSILRHIFPFYILMYLISGNILKLTVS